MQFSYHVGLKYTARRTMDRLRLSRARMLALAAASALSRKNAPLDYARNRIFEYARAIDASFAYRPGTGSGCCTRPPKIQHVQDS
jgi:hypothetical protein